MAETEIQFFKHPKLNQIFKQVLALTKNEVVYIRDEKNDTIHVLLPQQLIEIRKAYKYIYTSKGERKIEAIVFEYTTKEIVIYVNENNQIEVDTVVEEFGYCGE